MTEFYCSIPEYVNLPRHKRHNSYEDIVDLVKRPCGIWDIKQINALTGAIEVEQVCENNWSDNGISNMYDAVLRQAALGTQFTPANIMVIGALLNMVTTTASISSGGTVTSIQVSALIGNGTTIPSGTALIINPGSNQLAVTLTQAITGAGTFTVTSVPGPTSTIASGASVRYAYSAVPTADVSSGTLGTPVSYTSALPVGQYTKTITTGYGNRQIVVTNSSAYLFSTTGSPAASAGTYSEAWLSNANPVTVTSTVLRVAFDNPLIINSTTNGSISITEKL